MGLPKGWDAEAHKEWEAGRRAEAVGRILTVLHNARPATAEMALQAGFLTRDSRAVERKKYGRAKARRSFQFSKR